MNCFFGLWLAALVVAAMDEDCCPCWLPVIVAVAGVAVHFFDEAAAAAAAVLATRLAAAATAATELEDAVAASVLNLSALIC